jgi:signal peptidase II
MIFFYLLASLIVAFDQFTKKLAVLYLRDEQRNITIIPDWFKLTYAENRGIAFGVEFFPPAILLLLTIAISVTVMVYVTRSGKRNMLFLTTFALILGGGIGNLIDRMTLGRVVDFIHFDLYQGQIFGTPLSLWPIFNIADSAITIGACMLILLHDRIFSSR